MNKLTAVIVEDEQASRVALRNYLKKYCPQVELLGEASNINEGEILIRDTNPQVVFLDIEMPHGNAFDLLEKFNKVQFEVIFVTAFSQYALQALNLSACFYLLKPVSIDELVIAVSKVHEQIKNKKIIQNSAVLLENLTIENKQLKKMVLPMLNGFEVIVLKNLVRCQANDNLTDVFLADGSKKTVCRTLKFFEGILEEYDFVRVHKSHMINLNYVKLFKKGKGGEVHLLDGTVVFVSENRKKNFLDRFS